MRMSVSLFTPKAFSRRSAMSPERSALPFSRLDSVGHKDANEKCTDARLFLLLELFQHLYAVLVLRIQLDRLGVVLNRQLFLTCLHISFAEAVVGI